MRIACAVAATALWAASVLIAAPAVQAQTAAPAATQKDTAKDARDTAKPADAPAAKSTRASKPSAKAAEKPAAILDINTASAEELDTLPGIGKVRAARIIKGRPYKAKDELVDKKVLPKSVYEKLKDRIVARQS